MSSLTTRILDVAIVGGGVSGAYCAWRLKHANSNPNAGFAPTVALFEGSDRIGGRLASFTAPGIPHITGELGGMQFLSTHTLVSSLVQNKLHLPIFTQSQDKPLPELMSKNLLYLRGRHLRNEDLTNPARFPYNLDWSERDRDPVLLLRKALELCLPGVTSLAGPDLENFLETATVEGRPLYSWGFWNLLRRVISQEAYDYIRDSGGYDFMLSNLNAMSMIRECEGLFPGVTFNLITTGYDQVPLMLCQQFTAARGEVHLQHRLKAFDTASLPDGSEGLRLTFLADSEGWGPEAGGEPLEVFARSVILALPRHAIELLDQTGTILNSPDRRRGQELDRSLKSVTSIPIVKIFLCYPYPWWENQAPPSGPAISDLPIRQCWYYGVEGRQPGANPKITNALIMASFDDSQNVDYWDGLWNVPLPVPCLPDPEPPGEAQPGSSNWHAHRIPVCSPLVEDAHRQLLEIHNLRYAPQPYAACAIDWNDDPFGGGVHYWQHHVRSWELIPRLCQPMPPAPAFICGEAYSRTQGWVEGALETAEMVLQHPSFPFRLAPPDWILNAEKPAA